MSHLAKSFGKIAAEIDTIFLYDSKRANKVTKIMILLTIVLFFFYQGIKKAIHYTNCKEENDENIVSNIGNKFTTLLGNNKVSKFVAFPVTYIIFGLILGIIVSSVIGEFVGFLTEMKLNKAKKVCDIIGQSNDKGCIHSELRRQQMRQGMSVMYNR